MFIKTKDTRYITRLIFTLIIALLTGCEEYVFPTTDDGSSSSTIQPKILIFQLTTEDNPQLKSNEFGIIDENNQITVSIDYEVDSYSFVPTISLNTDDATITPSSQTSINGLEKTKYTLTNDSYIVEYEVSFVFEQASLALESLKINGTSAYINSDGEITIPIAQDKWEGPYVFDPIGVGYDNLYIDNIEITAGVACLIDLSLTSSHTITATKDDESISVPFKLTGIPIVSITADYSVDDLNDSEKTPLEISVYDPTDDGIYCVTDKYAGMKIRGASSAGKAKNSYSLEFRETGTDIEEDVKLFGLRNDGDWILDGMSTDPSRMRNRIGTDMWNDLHTLGYADSEPNARPATRGRMVELYFNDEYRGIYCMTERIDRKQLNLDKDNGYLYKTEGWTEANTFAGYSGTPSLGDETWQSYQAEYPSDPYDWTPLFELVQFICDNNDEVMVAGIAEKFDIDNLVDYFIFVNVLGGIDNTGKNTYIGAYDISSSNVNDHRFFYCPWDLDGTFGRNWDTSKIITDFMLCVIQWEEYPDNTNVLMKRLAMCNGADFGTKVKTRWAELKNSYCSTSSIIERFRAYQTELVGSGAYTREQTTWSDATDLGTEISYIETWLDGHIAYIDDYINNWDSNVSKLTW